MKLHHLQDNGQNWRSEREINTVCVYTYMHIHMCMTWKKKRFYFGRERRLTEKRIEDRRGQWG